MITLVLGLAVLGVILELIKTQLPIEPTILLLIRIIIVVSVIFYLMAWFGLVDIPIPRPR